MPSQMMLLLHVPLLQVPVGGLLLFHSGRVRLRPLAFMLAFVESRETSILQ